MSDQVAGTAERILMASLGLFSDSVNRRCLPFKAVALSTEFTFREASLVVLARDRSSFVVAFLRSFSLLSECHDHISPPL